MDDNIGFVYKVLSYKESSRLVFILSSNGNNLFIARAASRPTSKNFSYTNEFNTIKYNYIKRGSAYFLTSGNIIDNYQNIKNDVTKTMVALKIINLLAKYIDYVSSHKILYEFTHSILNNLKDTTSSIYYDLFRLKLLYLIGIGLQFKKCLKCNSNLNLHFVVKEGGVLCEKCLDYTKAIDNELNKYIQELYFKKNYEFSVIDLIKYDEYKDKLSVFLDDYYRYHN